MNPASGPEPDWNRIPLFDRDPKNQASYRVLFAQLEDGQMPARAYILSDEVTPTERETLWGYLTLFAQRGPQDLNRRIFVSFVGEDHEDGMCEFRLGNAFGNRILGFRSHQTVQVPAPPVDLSSLSSRERKAAAKEAGKPRTGPPPTISIEVATLLLAHGFTKPGQPETPPQEKTLARAYRARHLAKFNRPR